MATESASITPPSGRNVSAEWVLAILAVLTFALIPVKINTIYSGLPAHPLFLHVPVILIPVAAIAAIALVAVPRWFPRNGIWVGLVAIVALGALNLTMNAGDALRDDLGLNGNFGPASLIARHASAAGKLRVLTIVFTALLLIAVAVYRTDGPRVTGVRVVDRSLGAVRARGALSGALRVLVAVLAVACLYFVFHVGDLGAKAVWQGRVHGGGVGFPSGGGAASGAGSGGGGFPTGSGGSSSGAAPPVSGG